MSIPTHYVLKIFTDNPSLRVEYETAKIKHNETIKPYLNNENVPFDAGVDLFVPEDLFIEPNSHSNKIHHGIHCSMIKRSPNECDRYVGYYLYLRSSTGSKTPLRLSNHVGIIDATYRGEIMALFDNITSDVEAEPWKLVQHQRVVQLCAPDLGYPIVIELVDSKDNLGITERGDGGFGSTGQ